MSKGGERGRILCKAVICKQVTLEVRYSDVAIGSLYAVFRSCEFITAEKNGFN